MPVLTIIVRTAAFPSRPSSEDVRRRSTEPAYLAREAIEVSPRITRVGNLFGRPLHISRRYEYARFHLWQVQAHD